MIMALTEEEIVEFRKRYAISDDIVEFKIYRTNSDNDIHRTPSYLDVSGSVFSSNLGGMYELIIGIIDGESFPEITDNDNVFEEYIGATE